MPFKKGDTTWYRVRIGPLKDRQAAGELQRKVKETTPGAIVVPHP
jgi:cell division protein FtsN